MSVKIGLAGCGYWGVNLLRNFHKLGVLACISDASAERCATLSAQYDVKAVSWEQMLADESLDGIALAVPAVAHAQMAVEVLRSGKHCFVEKPLALSEEEAAAVMQAEAETGKWVMVGHLLQYHPAFIKLREVIESGELGALRYVYSNRLSLGKVRTEENVLWSFAPHDLSMVLSLIPEEPVSVSGHGGSYITPGVTDFHRVDMSFAGGVQAHVFVSWQHPFKEQRLVVVAERGMIVFEDSLQGADKLRLYRHALVSTDAAPVYQKKDAETVPFGNEEPLLNECAHFVSCIENGIKPRTDTAEALRVLKVLVRAD